MKIIISKKFNWRNVTLFFRYCQLSGLVISILFITNCSIISQGPYEGSNFYAEREKNASPAIQLRLQQLRQKIKEQGYTFEVGYTAALDRRLEELVGTRIPKDLATQMKKQNDLAASLLEVDLAARNEFVSRMGNEFSLPELTKPTCSATNKSYDWRKVGGVTAVRNQQCGNCWAYASMAALEASNMIRNTWNTDGSEQDIVSCAVDRNGNDAGICGSGWHAGVFDYMIDRKSVV